MAQLALADRANTRIYGLLSGRISELLDSTQHEELSESERETLLKGVELLRRCVVGSKLVEGNLPKGATPPSQESIRYLGYALSTLEALGELAKTQEASQVLSHLADSLERVSSSQGGFTVTSELDELRHFFSALAREFLRDLANQESRDSVPGRFLRARLA